MEMMESSILLLMNLIPSFIEVLYLRVIGLGMAVNMGYQHSVKLSHEFKP